MISILDRRTDEMIGWVSRVITDSHQDSIKNEEIYNCTISRSEPYAALMAKRARILIQAEEGDYREFIVQNTYESTISNTKEVYCTGSFLDLNKLKLIEPQVFEGQTVEISAAYVLAGIKEWELGIVEYNEVFQWVIDRRLKGYEALKEISRLSGLELHFRVTTDGLDITGRYVDFIKRKGMNRGKEIVFGKDLIGITRKINNEQIITSLKVIGPEKEDGSFLNVVVTNDAAFQNWNHKGEHLIDVYEPQVDANITLAELTKMGEKELQKRIDSIVEYDIDNVALDHILGYEHEIVRMGDTAFIKDEYFNPPLYLNARAVFIERSAFYKAKKKYKLGEVIEYSKADIMKTWRELQKAYGAKIISSPTPPPGRKDILWIKTGGSVEIAHRWDSILNKWLPVNGSMTWVMYADDAYGFNMSADATDKSYIGFAYNQTEETPSMDPLDYSWSLFKGSDGVRGPTGPGGEPTFTWIKYATSITGTGMDDDPTNMTHIGIAYNKDTQLESTDPLDYTWALFQGPKGDPGNGIVSVVEQYYLSTSATTQTGGAWSTTVPTWVDGKYIWTRSVITYTNSTDTTTTPVNVTGGKGGTGTPGVGVSKVDVWYYLSTSATALSGGSWVTTAPTWVDGRFMWSKTVVTYTDGTSNESTPANITGAKGSTGSTGPTGPEGPEGPEGPQGPEGELNLVNNPHVSGNVSGWSGGATYGTATFVDGRVIGVANLITAGNMQSSSDLFDIEPQKMYEFSVWLRQGTTKTANYFGLNVYNSAGSNIGVYPITTADGVKSSTLNTNPYFASVTLTAGVWVKYTGYIIPAGFDSTDPEFFRNLGDNVAWVMQFPGDAKKAWMRVLNFSNTATTTLTMAFPTVKEVDISVLEANMARNEASNNNAKLRQDLRITAPLPVWLTMDAAGITASTPTSGKFARMDYRGLYVQGGAIDIRTQTATNRGIILDALGLRGYDAVGNKTIDINNNGTATFAGDITSSADSTIGLRITSDGEFRALDPEWSGGRVLFNTKTTLPQLLDGNKTYGSIKPESHGKIYAYNFTVSVPAASYTVNTRVATVVNIADYSDVAIADVLSIQLTTVGKEWRCYETNSSARIYNGDDLYSIDLSISPHFAYTASATTLVQVTMLIIGIR